MVKFIWSIKIINNLTTLNKMKNLTTTNLIPVSSLVTNLTPSFDKFGDDDDNFIKSLSY